MSYSEQDGQVVLKMSREDYDLLLIITGMGMGAALMGHGSLPRRIITPVLNRLNSGNPNYTPYQVEEKK